MDMKDLEVAASLAQIELRPGDMERLGEAVSQMLVYFEKMKEVDTEGLEPTTHALVKENRVRSDVPNESSLADEIVDRSPEQEDRFIVIPNVL